MSDKVIYREKVIVCGDIFSCRDNSSYRLNTLGPLCLWQCFFEPFPNQVLRDESEFLLHTLNLNSMHTGLSLYDFRRVHEPKPGKIGTFDKNTDPLGFRLLALFKISFGGNCEVWSKL